MISMSACGCGGKPLFAAISSSFHTRSAPAHARGIRVVGEGKMMLGLEPAVVGAAEFVEGSAFDHDRCSTMSDPIMAPAPRRQKQARQQRSVRRAATTNANRCRGR
jgi:hypothetical protein